MVLRGVVQRGVVLLTLGAAAGIGACSSGSYVRDLGDSLAGAGGEFTPPSGGDGGPAGDDGSVPGGGGGQGGSGPASGGAGGQAGGTASTGGATDSGGAPAGGMGGAPATGGAGASPGGNRGVGASGGAAGAGTPPGSGGAAGLGAGGSAGAGSGAAGAGGGSILDPAQYNFEASTQGWGMSSGAGIFTAIGRSTAIKFAGVSSLEGAFTTVGNETFQLLIMPPPSIAAGTVVTFHVFLPVGASVDWVMPYLQQGANSVPDPYYWTGAFTLAANFVFGAWNTIPVQLPVPADSVFSLGVQFHTSGPWTGSIYVDSVRW